MIPEFVEGKKDGTSTVFILHVDKKKINDDFLDKLKQLDLDWNILLFLNKIFSVNVKNKISGEDYFIKKGKNHNNIYSLKKNDEIISSWLRKVYNLDDLKIKYNLSIVPKIIVAIYLKDNILTPLEKSENNKFYLYMPLESETNPFKFLIHADFECILNRGAFTRKKYNEDIFQCLKEKIFELVKSLSRKSEYSHCFLNVLPLPKDKEKFKDQFYSNLPEEISTFVKAKIAFTDNFGEKINIPFLANEDIIDLINDDKVLIKKSLKHFSILNFMISHQNILCSGK